MSTTIDTTKSDICPRCEEDTEDVKHWLKCPANIQDRLKIFGKTDVGLGALTEFPAEALASSSSFTTTTPDRAKLGGGEDRRPNSANVCISADPYRVVGKEALGITTATHPQAASMGHIQIFTPVHNSHTQGQRRLRKYIPSFHRPRLRC